MPSRPHVVTFHEHDLKDHRKHSPTETRGRFGRLKRSQKDVILLSESETPEDFRRKLVERILCQWSFESESPPAASDFPMTVWVKNYTHSIRIDSEWRNAPAALAWLRQYFGEVDVLFSVQSSSTTTTTTATGSSGSGAAARASSARRWAKKCGLSSALPEGEDAGRSSSVKPRAGERGSASVSAYASSSQAGDAWSEVARTSSLDERGEVVEEDGEQEAVDSLLGRKKEGRGRGMFREMSPKRNGCGVQ